jgi:hypothetical protein
MAQIRIPQAAASLHAARAEDGHAGTPLHVSEQNASPMPALNRADFQAQTQRNRRQLCLSADSVCRVIQCNFSRHVFVGNTPSFAHKLRPPQTKNFLNTGQRERQHLGKNPKHIGPGRSHAASFITREKCDAPPGMAGTHQPVWHRPRPTGHRPGRRAEEEARGWRRNTRPSHPSARWSANCSLLVPRDDCLALDANGWLRGVPGQCNRMPTPNTCEEK